MRINNTAIDLPAMLSEIEIQFYVERLALFDDKNSFKTLFTHFYERINRFVTSIVKNNELAEELTSDTFYALWKHRQKLLHVDNFKSYLYIIAKNISLKELTRQKHLTYFRLEDLDVQIGTIPDQSPEDYVISRELHTKFEKAVNALPPKCKLIYQLVKQDGLRYKEIASILNISVKTIDAQMAIATKRVTMAMTASSKVLH